MFFQKTIYFLNGVEQEFGGSLTDLTISESWVDVLVWRLAKRWVRPFDWLIYQFWEGVCFEFDFIPENIWKLFWWLFLGMLELEFEFFGWAVDLFDVIQLRFMLILRFVFFFYLLELLSDFFSFKLWADKFLLFLRYWLLLWKERH